jgi:hypothetical protein
MRFRGPKAQVDTRDSPKIQVCQFFCVNDQVLFLGMGCRGRGTRPLPVDVEASCGFMMQIAPGPASVPATES